MRVARVVMAPPESNNTARPLLHHRVALRRVWVLAFVVTWAPAQAESLDDRFNAVWESLWYQSGEVLRVRRWPGDIRVRVQGIDRSTHHERIVKALTLVAGVAGRTVVDVTDLPHAQQRPNLDVEVVEDGKLQDNFACLVRLERVQNGHIEKAVLRMRTSMVYHCVLHEVMHAMGIPGHPRADTVLSYFYQRVDQITALDRLILKAWYAPAMRPGAFAMEALVTLTDAVVQDDAGATADARARQVRFLAQTIRDMEAFATGQGEVPVVLKRSGTASAEGMRAGRRSMALFLGMAYLNGSGVAVSNTRAVPWIERSARGGELGAQMLMGYIHETGAFGVSADASKAYAWYVQASAQGHVAAQAAAKRVETLLTPEQREQTDTALPVEP